MNASLFRSGWPLRVCAAIAFGLGAFAAVQWIDRSAPTAASAPPQPTAPARPALRSVALHVDIESVAPVATWAVQFNGQALTPTGSSSSSWETTLACDLATVAAAGAQERALVISTTRASGSRATPNALRVTTEIDGVKTTELRWCPGDCAVTIPVAVFPSMTLASP